MMHSYIEWGKIIKLNQNTEVEKNNLEHIQGNKGHKHAVFVIVA